MTITKESYVSEILVRFDRGQIKGAHRVDGDFVYDGDTLISEKLGNAEAITKEQALQMIGDADLVGDALPLPPLSASQVRLGLLANGITTAMVDASIAAIEDEAEKEAARIKWEYAASIGRNEPLVAAIGASLGLTDEQIDAMWQQALAM